MTLRASSVNRATSVNVVQAGGRFMGTLSRSPLVRDLYTSCANLPVIGPVLRDAVRKVLPAGSRVWIRVPQGIAQGLWLLLDLRFESQFIASDHERPVQDILTRHLKPGDCFYDVGAHIGFFSLIAGKAAGPSGRVIAIEPDPSNGSILRANAGKNNFPQIRIIQAAAWSGTGTLCFERSNAASSRMEGRISDDRDTNREAEIVQVKGIALDDLVFRQGLPVPDFLKIDVEGAESETLKGAKQIFRTCKPLLLCEVHDASNHRFVESWLAACGYRIEWLDTREEYPKQLFALFDKQ